MSEEILYDTGEYDNPTEQLIANKKARKVAFKERLKNTAAIMKRLCHLTR